MQKYEDVVIDQKGNGVNGATITIYDAQNVLASIYSDDGLTPKSNPFQTDEFGRILFYAANGRYQVVASGTGITSYTLADIVLQDPAQLLHAADIIGSYVVSGLLPSVPGSGLVMTTPAGVAYVLGTRVGTLATSKTYTASKDTYVDISSRSVFTYSEVANGAGAPAVASSSIRLFKVVTNSGNVSSVTDLRETDQQLLNTHLNSIANSTSVSAIRDYLQLNSGQSGDIWVEKAGDTMSGDLVVNGFITVGSGGKHLRLTNVAGDQFASLYLDASNIVQLNYPAKITGSLQVGAAPTGGDRGAGTINVDTNYYRDGVAQGVWTAYDPVVTLVGGAGNTVPVYTTNDGRYCRVGDLIRVEVNLDGDGGAEGAGTGVFSVELPVDAGASQNVKQRIVGNYTNGATFGLLLGYVYQSNVTLQKITGVDDFTGADQNNATRNVTLSFSYEA